MIAPRKRRPYAPRVPSAQRRTELLDAALHLIVTKGHQATTMEAVAEQVGVSKPVVYGQFANRADLLATLLRREQEQALGQLRASLPVDLAAPPGQVVGELLDRFLAEVQRHPDRWRCIVLPMPDMPAEFHAAREHARTLALARVRDLVTGLLPARDELDPRIVAHALLSLFEMAARLVLVEPENYRPEQFVAAVRALFRLEAAAPGSPAGRTR